MNIVPKIGMDDVLFGESIAELLDRLGSPVSEHTLDDIDTHPKSRLVLNYVNRGFLATPELGVISITVETEQSLITLWGTEINSMNQSELAEFLTSKQCDARIGTTDGWGDSDVESLDHGIIASFSENQLESIELHDPTWRTTDRDRDITM